MKASTLRGLMMGATLALGFAVVAPSSAQAQSQSVRFGVEAAWANDYDLGVGAFAKFHLADVSEKAITGRVSFDYFFPGNNVKFWEINGDGLLDIVNKSSSIKPYVGAGIHYTHWSWDNNGICSLAGADCNSSDVGLNLLGGLNFGNSKMMPFVEAKLEVGNGSEFMLKGGIHF